MPITKGEDALHISILHCDCVTIDSSWDWRVRSTFWRIYVNSTDGAELIMDHGRYRLTASRIHILPPWRPFVCVNSVPIRHLYIHFDVVGLSRSLVRELFPLPVSLSVDGEGEASARRIAGLVSDQRETSPTLLCEVKALTYRSLSRALTALPANLLARLRHSMRGSDSIAPALRLMQERTGTALRNRALARACAMSESRFIKRFHTCMGQTPAQYGVERRLALAARQLATTTDSIDAIAGSCGFLDRFTFSRAFSRRMGIAPAAYRRRSRL